MSRAADPSQTTTPPDPGSGQERAAPQPVRKRPPTPLDARGESMVWLTGGALTLALALIIGLILIIVVNGTRTFWPDPVQRVELASGEVFAGVEMSSEPDPDEGTRTLYRVGNRDIQRDTFRWVPDAEVVSAAPGAGLVMVDRLEWGVWLGKLESVAENGETVWSWGDDWSGFQRLLSDAAKRRAEIEKLAQDDLGSVNAQLEASRLRVKAAEIAASERIVATGMPFVAWVSALLVGAAGLFVAVRGVGGLAGRSATPIVRVAFGAVASVAVLAAGLEHPWAGEQMSPERLEAIAEREMEVQSSLGDRASAIEGEIRQLRAADESVRVALTDATGEQRAIDRRSSGDLSPPLSQVVRVARRNDAGLAHAVGVYFDRWWEYLSQPPRESNTDGGVMPVIFGTVLLTLLLCIAVVPLGVIAAVYLREYAKQGTVTSLVRIAVNNLAGVPSIVYGVFGLGFFCYTVGGYIDQGPENPMARFGAGGWWPLAVLVAILAPAGAAAVVLSRPAPGQRLSRREKLFRNLGVLLWGAVVAGAFVLIARTPYFGGLFEAQLPTPTFGGRGLLWASLTLALLTLPVVIVATEEAISAVPGSMREGSYGCGASKWQTIRRIVLPASGPGVMTGAILAMARGAGEVAPLMIVGAVKSAPDLPISGHWPFVHLERSFMHLGFHIYDLGFQSPDSEAARPMLWTTTLLLLTIVLTLNLVAIVVRARLRAKLHSGGGV
ncbi:MAG: ABC transporter permease subunit [Planctomycetota bacterium]